VSGRKRQGAGLQRGLVGVCEDEAPLPSEQVLSGEVLGARRREAGTGMRRLLGDRPENFTAEEWRVVLAILSPDEAAGATAMRGRVPSRQEAAVGRALACFPGMPAPAALRAYRETSARPHVRSVIADVRALEGIDVLAHRDMVRARLLQVAALADDLQGDDGASMGLVDPSGAAKLGLAVVAACKGLADLDGLKVTGETEDTAGDAGAGERTGDTLRALLRRTHDDLASRKVLPVVDAAAEPAC